MSLAMGRPTSLRAAVFCIMASTKTANPQNPKHLIIFTNSCGEPVYLARVHQNFGARYLHELRIGGKFDRVQNLYQQKTAALLTEKRAVQVLGQHGKPQFRDWIGNQLLNEVRDPSPRPEYFPICDLAEYRYAQVNRLPLAKPVVNGRCPAGFCPRRRRTPVEPFMVLNFFHHEGQPVAHHLLSPGAELEI